MAAVGTEPLLVTDEATVGATVLVAEVLLLLLVAVVDVAGKEVVLVLLLAVSIDGVVVVGKGNSASSLAIS